MEIPKNKLTAYAILIIKIAIVIFAFLPLSCKKETYSSATIFKDCTGTYLRILDKDYQVCNTEKTDNFSHQQRVTVNFALLKECPEPIAYNPLCGEIRPHAGPVNIIDIRAQ
jgi:hypothetical protein